MRGNILDIREQGKINNSLKNWMIRDDEKDLFEKKCDMKLKNFIGGTGDE